MEGDDGISDNERITTKESNHQSSEAFTIPLS
jgi:hypothetical protein